MKKKTSQKRNKLPLLLGALLLISLAAYGTRAYFSDSATEQAGIKLTLGNIKIENKSAEWIYTSANTGQKNAVKAESNYTNVSGGDSFTKSFEFKNTGTLRAFATIEQNLIEIDNIDETKYDVPTHTYTYPEGPYEISIILENPTDYEYFLDKKTLILDSEKSLKFDIKISLTKDIDKKYNDKENVGIPGTTLDLVDKSIIVTATDHK